MPLPPLDPAGTAYFALEDDGVVELYLDYTDPASGKHAQARTWWHPAIRILGGLRWRHLRDRDEALGVASERSGPAVAGDDLTSLEHRVQVQLT